MTLCPCQSSQDYAQCCAPFHHYCKLPETAEQLMRSRYAAYVLQNMDYILTSTVPAQQDLLDKAGLIAWSQQTEWLGLTVHAHTPHIKPHHAQVEFTAYFEQEGGVQAHHELSAFVKIDGRWYFIDPTVRLPSMKSPCICGSMRKFKVCCGQFFK
ncbi:MAG: YchJ family protein [Alysiella sp.]|uniref:YchJ family protein n=1 Tax=Alysiella sp. TaxID=1872483 RepID=UPI0026DC42CB|nr:YchJ family protein [Alysiella sp.]MDO4433799.1 YchJ family protein [Alysiella sp.]